MALTRAAYSCTLAGKKIEIKTVGRWKRLEAFHPLIHTKQK
jgi:hypothetical protein